MKKVLCGICMALACSCAFAQEQAAAEQNVEARPTQKAPWPVWLSFNSSNNPDIIGFRFNIVFGESESVTGFDIGIFGRAHYFEGCQFNILRNDVKDVFAGVQCGIYNSAGRADAVGVQVGLFNEVRSMRGVQVGLFNVAETLSGFQVGLINRCETMYGFQAGGVNVIRDSELAFFPIVNVGFDTFTDL